MTKIPLNDKTQAIIDRYSDACLEKGYSTEKINKKKIIEIITGLYALLELKTPEVVFVNGPLDAINKAVELGDARDKQNIRYDLFVANWRGYWFRRYGAGLELDPNIYEEKHAEELRQWLALADEGHAYLCYEELVIVTERPEFIAVDQEGRLHHESRAALRERDGVEIYAWHGIEVPSQLITQPDKITIAAIDAEPNQEIKRVMLERFTIVRYLQESNAKIVDKDFDKLGAVRCLYKKKIIGTEVNVFMLQVKNSTAETDGTVKDYFLEIHPECRPMKRNSAGQIQLGEPQKMTCQNAVASTFGMYGHEYAPIMET